MQNGPAVTNPAAFNARGVISPGMMEVRSMHYPPGMLPGRPTFGGGQPNLRFPLQPNLRDPTSSNSSQMHSMNMNLPHSMSQALSSQGMRLPISPNYPASPIQPEFLPTRPNFPMVSSSMNPQKQNHANLQRYIFVHTATTCP